MKKRNYNGVYKGESLSRVAFPLGGLGAGMVALEGTGALSHVSVRHKPEVFNEPYVFAALCLKGAGAAGSNLARVLEGPVPAWKLFGAAGAGNGLGTRTYGLPRFASATFQARFPFGTVKLRDPQLPVDVELTGWSPFLPGNADDSSLPLAALEYRIKNRSDRPLEAVFSFNAKNPMVTNHKLPNAAHPAGKGIVFSQEGSAEAPWEGGRFYMGTDAPGAAANCAWFRGGWFDSQTVAWQDVESGRLAGAPAYAEGASSFGGSLLVPLMLPPGASQTVRVLLAWHVPVSRLRVGAEEPAAACGAACDCDKTKPITKPTHVPWYAGRFADVAAVADYGHAHYARLRKGSALFSRCFYDTTLPAELVEAAAANLTILKSPTVLRQADGRLWAWEGCCDGDGCCHGTCTHVWNYAQAIPHLFPDLERSLRETEFRVCQDDRGHQAFRASLPIRPPDHAFHAAADGQLGGIMKVYREWRISGNTEWLRGLWPAVRKSLDYCIETWDPKRQGALFEPHHNTYDIEFWGPDGMCTSFYLGALKAATAMGEALGDDAAGYRDLLARGLAFMETALYDGEYFIQKIQWTGLRAADPTALGINNAGYSTEAKALLEKEGPKYQYGSGCLSDGVLGAWMGHMCGVPAFLNPEKEKSHCAAIHHHNLRRDLTAHVNPQRPTFAAGAEGGLLLCSWPKGGALSLPFVYSNEVWTGIEYQAAGHMILQGLVQEGLEVVRVCRDRYDGRVRNPFNEYECGHWYARAMASYGLLQAYGGVRYDAVEKTLHIKPAVKGDFRVFLCTAAGYGTAGIKDGKPFVETVSGKMDMQQILS
jgi:uncharacterized protein (DUF608 family)